MISSFKIKLIICNRCILRLRLTSFLLICDFSWFKSALIIIYKTILMDWVWDVLYPTWNKTLLRDLILNKTFWSLYRHYLLLSRSYRILRNFRITLNFSYLIWIQYLFPLLVETLILRTIKYRTNHCLINWRDLRQVFIFTEIDTWLFGTL